MYTSLKWLAACAVVTILVPAPAAAQSPEERTAAREIVRKRGDAVGILMATLRMRITVNGTEQPAREQPIAANVTVIDPSGLSVAALTPLKPDDAMERQATTQLRGAKVEVQSELTNLRMRLADGREIAMKQVLTDEDLDLAFLRPVESLPGPVPAIDGVDAKLNLLDFAICLQRAQENVGFALGASFVTVQFVLDKPRTYYVISAPPTLGAPAFAANGAFAGLVLIRTTGARGTGAPALLPAADIREAAKQAK